MTMKRILMLALGLGMATLIARADRERICFDQDWKFARFGPMPDGSTNAEPPNLERTDVADWSWRKLNLPHDWGIEGPFRGDLPGETGKLPWAGIGWYRKTFVVPKSDEGRRVFLDFDGAMSHPKVYVNGQFAGEWAYGYNSFHIEIT